MARRTFDEIARAVGTALPVPLAMVTLVGPDGQDVVGVHAAELASDAASELITASVLCRRVVLAGKPVIVHDVRRRVASGADELAALDVAGYAGVPILVDDVAVGAVAAVDHRTRAWSARDVELLRRFAEIVSVVVHERTLNTMVIRCAEATNLIDFLAAVVAGTGWPCADVVTIEQGRVHLLASYERGRGGARGAPPAPWPFDSDALVREAMTRADPIWHDELRGRARSNYARRFDGDVSAAFAIAIPARSAVLEVFTSGSRRDRAPMTDVARPLGALLGALLARLTPAAPADARIDELEMLALHDELTGLLNRRGFHAVANGQLAVARRNRTPGMMLFIDVDGLKDVNDRAGHSAGDALLRLAAGVLRATFRDADTIARLGGDEFVVLSIDSMERDLGAVVGRLTHELDRFNGEIAPAPPLRWSVGFVAFGGERTESLDTLMGEADRRMYETKRQTHARPQRGVP